MITVSNTYIPSLSKRKESPDQKIIAETDAGDIAYYTTRYSKQGRSRMAMMVMHDDDDDDDDDMLEARLLGYHPGDDDDITSRDFLYGKPVQSLSGADWHPHLNERLTMFIAGAPGAGKSYLAKQMIKLLPSSIPILLFTALSEKDGNFDELGKDRIYKIKMTPEVLSSITLEEIRKKCQSSQAILLFDDIDNIHSNKIQNLTFGIMNDALANGRGHEKHDGNGDLNVICTSHAANDYTKTKYMFENSNYVALFPGATPPMQMYRMFDKMGLDKDLCMRMIKLARSQKIRSIIIHKIVPMYMIFGNKIMLL